MEKRRQNQPAKFVRRFSCPAGKLSLAGANKQHYDLIGGHFGLNSTSDRSYLKANLDLKPPHPPRSVWVEEALRDTQESYKQPYRDFDTSASQKYDNLSSYTSLKAHLHLADSPINNSSVRRGFGKRDYLTESPEVDISVSMANKRHSFPTVITSRSSADRARSGHVGTRLSAPGLSGQSLVPRKDRSTSARRFSLSTVDRELQCLYQNNHAERQLSNHVVQLEKQSCVGVKEHKHQCRELCQQHRATLRRTPSTDKWLDLNNSRTTQLKEREREEIAKRHTRLMRIHRAPPHLQEMVSKIRNYVLMESGVMQRILDADAPEVAESKVSDSKAEGSEDLVEDSRRSTTSGVPLRLQRRHTVVGDSILRNRPQSPDQAVEEENGSPRTERRISKCDIKLIKDLLEFRNGKAAAAAPFAVQKDVKEEEKNGKGNSSEAGKEGNCQDVMDRQKEVQEERYLSSEMDIYNIVPELENSLNIYGSEDDV